jgi:surface polysaccharide O-acyltransferase-like enzyme
VQDYVIGTLLYGIGVGITALSGMCVYKLAHWVSIGRVVLGIYASHYLFVDLFYGFASKLRGYPGWLACYVAIVFMCALALSLLLARYSWTRQLVM